MKVLFVLYYYFPDENANTNVTQHFINELADKHDVAIFVIHQGKASNMTEKYNGLSVYRSGYDYLSSEENAYLKSYKGMIRDPAGSYLLYLLKRYLLNYIPVELMVKKLPCLDALKKLVEKEKYDVIFSASAPFETHMLVSKLKKFLKSNKIKWNLLIEDPHSEYIGFKERCEYLRNLERYIYGLADKIYIFAQIAGNKNDVINEFPEKKVIVNYPNFRINKSVKRKFEFSDDEINLLYVGSLQDLNVRNPEYLYKMIYLTQNKGFHYHFVVNNWDDENRKLKQDYLKNCKNVTFYERMSIEDCISFMNSVDVVINISNLCINQVPSKIFDYIGTGKPIANFYVNESDPALEILNKYPLLINMDEKISVEENSEVFIKKCVEFKNKTVDDDELCELYKDYTSEFAALPVVRDLEN